MLISPRELKTIWKVIPNGILHVGAHEAEEASLYDAVGWSERGKVIWVEAQKALADALALKLARPKNKVYCAAVWDKDGVEMNLNITSNSQSTSLLDLGTHQLDYPGVVVVAHKTVKTQRLDSLLQQDDTFNFINLDIQGAELPALIGLGARIRNINWIYTEVNKQEVYKDCTLITQLDSYLRDFGFCRATTQWVRNAGWGDALYVKEELLPQGSIRAGLLVMRVRGRSYRIINRIMSRIWRIFKRGIEAY